MLITQANSNNFNMSHIIYFHFRECHHHPKTLSQTFFGTESQGTISVSVNKKHILMFPVTKNFYSKNKLGNIASSILLVVQQFCLTSLSLFRNRVRHVDEHFDLDLTYITDRIIGMPEFVKELCLFQALFLTITRKCCEKVSEHIPNLKWNLILLTITPLLMEFYMYTALLSTVILVPVKQISTSVIRTPP